MWPFDGYFNEPEALRVFKELFDRGGALRDPGAGGERMAPWSDGSGRDHWQPDGELMVQGVTAAVEEGMRSAKGITRQPDGELVDIGVTAVVERTMRGFLSVHRQPDGNSCPRE